MKIFLPGKPGMTGGASSFAHKFKQGMTKRGHGVVFESGGDYDVLLISPRAPLSSVWHARRQGKIIIHRLDGAYYPTTTSGWLFPAYNAPLTAIQYLSRHTIYQSKYAQWICQRLVGPRSSRHTSIIYNGVDMDHFMPEGPSRPLGEQVFFTAQQFRRRDQIEPLVQALEAYNQRYQTNAQLVVAGDFIDEAASLWPVLQKNPTLQLLGSVANDKLPEYLRAADAFLYCHPNPACPNNILEAMACGVPIVGINDGAMPELVRYKQDGYLIPRPGHSHLLIRPFDIQAFAAAMHSAATDRARLGHNARKRVLAAFTLDHMIEGYLELFTNFLAK